MLNKIAAFILILALIPVAVILGKDMLATYEIRTVLEKAEGGDVSAQIMQAQFYRLGTWGIETNRERSIYWLKQAKRNGSKTAEEMLCWDYKIGCEP